MHIRTSVRVEGGATFTTCGTNEWWRATSSFGTQRCLCFDPKALQTWGTPISTPSSSPSPALGAEVVGADGYSPPNLHHVLMATLFHHAPSPRHQLTQHETTPRRSPQCTCPTAMPTKGSASLQQEQAFIHCWYLIRLQGKWPNTSHL